MTAPSRPVTLASPFGPTLKPARKLHDKLLAGCYIGPTSARILGGSRRLSKIARAQKAKIELWSDTDAPRGDGLSSRLRRRRAGDRVPLDLAAPATGDRRALPAAPGPARRHLSLSSRAPSRAAGSTARGRRSSVRRMADGA